MTPELEKLAKSLEWQPIETAPKDGTKILIKVPDYGVFEACYFEADEGSEYKDGWMSPCTMNGLFRERKVKPHDCPKPSHWMPLPTGNAGEVIRVLAAALNAVYHRVTISRQMFDAGNIIRDVVFQALPAENEVSKALARAEQLAGGGAV